MASTTTAKWRSDLADLSAMLDRVVKADNPGDAPDAVPPDAVPPYVDVVRRLAVALEDGAPSVASSSSGLEAALNSAIRRGCAVANAAVVASAAAASAAPVDAAGEVGVEGGPPTDAERARIQRVVSALYYLGQCHSASSVAWRVMTSDGDVAASDEDLAAGLARFSAPDAEEANRMQQLLLYLLNTAQVKGYRRRHGEMYRRVAEAAGRYDTHAWERVSDMRDFVYASTRKEVNFDMWLNLTCMRTNVQAAIDHLVSCQDVQLPELRPDRHVFSFEDGIYLAASDRFVRYNTPAHSALPTEMVAAKHFAGLRFERVNDEPEDREADEAEDDWYSDIATPHMQSILDYQKMGEAVSRWMYALVGRMIYEVGELDGWQVLPFLKGAASSGKSTILTRVCRGLYMPGDVGTLSNNIEKKFGLSALADKLIFIGPEIKSDIALEQAEFQSIVSGETVQIATKFKTAQTVEWRVPGALAGNEVPGWVDNAGSINRRIVLFDFPHRVHDGDMELGRKLDREMPALLLKCNRAYLQAVHRHAKENIWKHLPAAFHDSKVALAESVNSIVHFLNSGQLEFSRDAYMPFEKFAAAYEAYVSSMGLQRLRLNGDRISQPLLQASCTIMKNQVKAYPRHEGSSVVTGCFMFGCDLVASRHGNGGGAGWTEVAWNESNST